MCTQEKLKQKRETFLFDGRLTARKIMTRKAFENGIIVAMVRKNAPLLHSRFFGT